jgi:hypothetical protein
VRAVCLSLSRQRYHASRAEREGRAWKRESEKKFMCVWVGACRPLLWWVGPTVGGRTSPSKKKYEARDGGLAES